MTAQSVNCEHCGASMELVKRAGLGVPADTYFANCRRLDLPATRGTPGTIYPQRCGEICYRSVSTATA